MRPLAKKALKMIQEQGGRVIDHDLIDRTLREIRKEYRPGLLAWIKEDRKRWGKLLDLEDQINRVALSGDEGALTKALEAYQELFKDMVSEYEGKGHYSKPIQSE